MYDCDAADMGNMRQLHGQSWRFRISPLCQKLTLTAQRIVQARGFEADGQLSRTLGASSSRSWQSDALLF